MHEFDGQARARQRHHALQNASQKEETKEGGILTPRYKIRDNLQQQAAVRRRLGLGDDLPVGDRHDTLKVEQLLEALLKGVHLHKLD